MRHPRITAAFAVMALATFAIPSASAVVGVDRAVRSGEASWTASVIRWNNDSGWSSFCSGTLISPSVVLTAAHCVLFTATEEAQTWKVTVGQSAMDAGDGETRDVIGVAYHQKYERQQSYDILDPVTLQVTQSINGYVLPGESYYDADLALLYLDRPITNIEPVKLAKPTTALAPHWRVYGWGMAATDDWGGSNTLLTTSVDDATDEMRATLSEPMENMLAAYLVDETGTVHSTCFGDSGGPLVDGNGVQIGITSFAFTDACEEEAPTLYTKVSSYRSWILRNARMISYRAKRHAVPVPVKNADVRDSFGRTPYHQIYIYGTY